MKDLNVEMGSFSQKAEDLRSDGQTAMFVIIDQKVAGVIGVADPIKETTPQAIQALHDEGIRIVMLTGDSRTTAEVVAKKLGIDDVVAEILPDRSDFGEGRFAWHRARQKIKSRHHAQHQTESFLCFHLQCTRCTRRGRNIISVFWNSFEPNHRRRRDEF